MDDRGRESRGLQNRLRGAAEASWVGSIPIHPRHAQIRHLVRSVTLGLVVWGTLYDSMSAELRLPEIGIELRPLVPAIGLSSSTSRHMVNYRVASLGLMLRRLRNACVALYETTEDSEFCTFGLATDPIGNRFELLEPAENR